MTGLPPPCPELTACVVVPARNEERLIGACIRALCEQRELRQGAWEILLVLDGCTDDTEGRALAAASGGAPVHVVHGNGLGAGGARAVGMDLAYHRLDTTSADGLIATTDADSRVEPDWLIRQLEAAGSGASAIGGLIVLDEAGSESLWPGTLAQRAAHHDANMTQIASDGPTEHPFFGGASIGITAAAYRAVGGMKALQALEDEDLARRLRSRGIEIHRLDSVRVTTSARTEGRAPRGLAHDFRVSEWHHRRTYDAAEFPLERLLEAKRSSVSLILPAEEVAGTIGPIIDELTPLRDAGLIDELIVVDAASLDGTAEIAALAGAQVLQEAELLPEFGPPRGKGDAMWRAAAVTEGEVIAFCDADSRDFRAEFALGVLGPILCEPGVRLVKGAFERPFDAGQEVLTGEGGRVTELVARPLLNLHFPALAGLEQPLAGEIAIDRDLLSEMEVPVGYGVEIAMLIDALRVADLDSIAQTRLGSRQNRHQPLRALGRMAYEVTVAAQRRIEGAPSLTPGPLLAAGDPSVRLQPRCEERPQLRSLAGGERQPALLAGRSN